MNRGRNGSALVVVLLIVIVILIAGGVWYYYSTRQPAVSQTQAGVANPGNATTTTSPQGSSLGQSVYNSLNAPSANSPVWTFNPATSVTAASTAGWNNFENATGSLSLLYPAGYSSRVLYSGTAIDAEFWEQPSYDGTPLVIIQTFPAESADNFSSWENSQIFNVASTTNEVITTSTVTVAGYPALKAVFAYTDAPRTEYFVSINANFHVQIDENYNTEYSSADPSNLSSAQLQNNKATSDAMIASLKFSIASAGTKNTGTSITITAPAGGESFSSNQKITLQWSTSNYSGNNIGLLFVPANESLAQARTNTNVETQNVLNIGDMNVSAPEENLSPGSYYLLMYIPCATQPDCPNYAYTKPFTITN